MEITNTEERAEQLSQLTPAENTQAEAPAVRRPRLTPEQRKQREAARKRKQILNYMFLGLFAAMFLVEIFAFVAVVRLKMLPGLLVALMALVFLAYDVLVANFMFLRGGKVPKKKAKMMARRRRIIAGVLAVVMFCGSIVVSNVANDVRKTIESVQATAPDESEEPVGITRTVYVRTYDKAQTLEEAKDYRFGIITGYDDVCTQQAVEAIEAQLGASINTQSYLSVFEMANAVLAGQLDAMILKSGYISILEADERYETFSENTRSLAEVQIEGNGEELDGSGLAMNAEADIAENGKLKPFIMYISGSDSREGTLDGNTRSDVNILAVVNPETRQVLLLNTPRDYYVPMPLVEGAYDKLTHCGIYGIDCSMKSLAALYECDVQYYAQINFEGFENLVDALGGITIESDVAFTLYKKAGKIKVGENELNGKKALAFARTRKGLDGGDLDRGKNQMKVIKAIIEKATSGTTIISNYSAIMESVDGMFVMNVPMSLISEVVKKQLSDMSGWNIVSYSVKGEGENLECYSSPGELLYAIKPTQSYVDNAKTMIQQVLNGETLQG